MSVAISTKKAQVADTAVGISAWGFAAADLAAAQRAIICSRTGGVMITWEGTTPTAVIGHLVATSGSLILDGNGSINALQAIREAAQTADVTITLEKF